LAQRSFPGPPDSFCGGGVTVDSRGDIFLVRTSYREPLPSTFDLQPELNGPFYLVKLDRATLETKFVTRMAFYSMRALTVADDGSIWLGGYTRRGLPTTPDAVELDYPGPSITLDRDRAGYLVRLSADGSRVLYATYLGITRDAVASICIDRSGNVYAVGSRIWKFSPTGRLIWSTWLPPSSAFRGVLGPTGDLYVVGSTGGYDFYTTPGAYQATPYFPQRTVGAGASIAYPNVSYDGFVARFSSDGGLIYSTLLGGVAEDYLYSVEVEADGSALVSGFSDGLLFPTRSAIAIGAGRNVIAKLFPDGSGVHFSTYLPVPWAR